MAKRLKGFATGHHHCIITRNGVVVVPGYMYELGPGEGDGMWECEEVDSGGATFRQVLGEREGERDTIEADDELGMDMVSPAGNHSIMVTS